MPGRFLGDGIFFPLRTYLKDPNQEYIKSFNSFVIYFRIPHEPPKRGSLSYPGMMSSVGIRKCKFHFSHPLACQISNLIFPLLFCIQSQQSSWPEFHTKISISIFLDHITWRCSFIKGETSLVVTVFIYNMYMYMYVLHFFYVCQYFSGADVCGFLMLNTRHIFL